ncbi:hypothetical protein R5397_04395 [Borrelia sp. MN22-0132]|uniref:hypothetical protein n=1 Tax=Borrelia sp. MN22-0132 TaxID=3085635 RepID=UPI003BA324E7
MHFCLILSKSILKLLVYEFVIENYQVFKNYLKYRKRRELSIDEIEHFDKLIKVIRYTIDIQKQIDLIICNLQKFDNSTLFRGYNRKLTLNV